MGIMDLTELLSIAKFNVGDVVLKFGRPHLVLARYYSRRRQNIVYDLRSLEDPHASVDYRVGQGLLQPLPNPTDEPEWSGPIDPSWDD